MTVEDIKCLNLNDEWIKNRYSAYLEANTGLSWIMEDDIGLLGAFGVVVYWGGIWGDIRYDDVIKGTCEVWYIPISIRKITGQIKKLKDYITDNMEKHNVHRIQAVSSCSSKASRRLLGILGFKCETPEGMANFFPDGTKALLYSRTL